MILLKDSLSHSAITPGLSLRERSIFGATTLLIAECERVRLPISTVYNVVSYSFGAIRRRSLLMISSLSSLFSCRATVAWCKPVRSAMQETIEKAVYWDDDFEPGEEWFNQIKQYIDDAPQLFVFWCGHSSVSTQIRREFRYALKRKKRVVPILLDNTPLTNLLKNIHGIDLRDAIMI